MKKNSYISSHFFELLLSVPKSIYFNYKILPLKKALKLPFIISYHISIKGINKNNFIVDFENLYFACSRIGFEYTDGCQRECKKGLIKVDNGKIILKGKVGLSQGIILSAKNSTITLGSNFRCNYSTSIISCDSDIMFGDDVVLGWAITVKSDDGHHVIDRNVIKPKSLPVKVGNHVWICSESTVLKGVNIGNDCIVAYGSLVSGATFEDNLMIAGIPAKKIKENVSWKE